jgi:2-methylcitrate dehydratase PrpD
MGSINTVSGKLAEFICNLQIDQLPKSVIERAQTRLLDCLSTGLAAHGLHVPSVVLAFTEGGSGPASVIGYQKSLPIVDAAFVNATLINGRSQDAEFFKLVVA